MSGNMDYEDTNVPRARSSEFISTDNFTTVTPRMIHHNPYENSPDPLYNPYHETRYNPNNHPRYKPLHNPGYASFHPVPKVIYDTTRSSKEYSRNSLFLDAQRTQSLQPNVEQKSTILPPPKNQFKAFNRISNKEVQTSPHSSDEVNDPPPESPQDLGSIPREDNLENVKPAQYRAYRFVSIKKPISVKNAEYIQALKERHERQRHLVPSKLVASDTEYLVNQQTTPPDTIEVWKNEDYTATENIFKGFKLASGITSIIVSSFEEDYKLIKTLEKNGLVKRNPEKGNLGKKKEMVQNSNFASLKKTVELDPKINNKMSQLDSNVLEKKQVIMPRAQLRKKEKKKEKEVDLDDMLEKAIKRAAERARLQPLNFQSYQNGSYPLRRSFDHVRWRFPRELI